MSLFRIIHLNVGVTDLYMTVCDRKVAAVSAVVKFNLVTRTMKESVHPGYFPNVTWKRWASSHYQSLWAVFLAQVSIVI